MAGVIKWKMMSCGWQDRAQNGRKIAKVAGGTLSVAPNRYKFQNYEHFGYIGDSAESFICRPLKSELRSKVGLYVAVKVHNKDADGSCNSEVADEDNETLSKASREMEVNHLGALRCYFSKLNTEKTQNPYYSLHLKNNEETLSKTTEEANVVNDYGNFNNTLDSLEVRFNRRNTGTKGYLSTAIEDYTNYLMFDEKNFLDMQKEDQTSSFCLTNLLAAINIAVLLFEIASPVRNYDIENLSLPLMYGAKINDLILSGEWWRLLTPMCLHSGLLHIALGCWVLLTFGPRVCRAYGQATFLLIYILGGVCGNLTSYVHTSELTVCGTGPVFALIGAWLVYQSQNKDAVDKNVSETMFRQAVVATALSFLLSSFGRIDNWTHLGATISGLLFGYLTCPSVQLDKEGQKEAVVLVRRQASPCKSIAIFVISIIVLSLFAFAYGTQA
ncbi:RHOMBOID-like protein 9, chloroplastic [Oryza brachyantha]|uniref:Peptidase S54 rhomboid domain-containing protein n=1 Tax=Oryza brachyantha TaxID=4533 RepID=J3LCD6_ORYBR|nr:RHOMBOID-like protein 9, chloroplastic [Oryza brachyantha]XP_015689399.1 RHOMBOID-like protein 9, chloroplastic [Oryza brachyantha]